MLQRPRGTRDFLPDEMEARAEIEGRMREAARCFGYRPIRTPAFEELELFTLRSGPGIVNEMYAFEDKGGRAIALRPELTAPVLRLYVNEARVLPKPLRWYYVDDCFRYERPQKGRYRQFWQFGAELIGVDSAGADAEVVLLADAALRAAGVEYELKVGHLALLRSLLADLDEGASRTVMGLLDKREMDGLADALAALDRTDLLSRLEALVDAATLDAAFDVTGPLPEEARLRELVALLDAAGLAYSLNFGIVRGLDYYTGMVFEGFAANLGAENQIVGGGAYRLAHLFGGEDTPSCGFAIGFDRVMVALGDVALPHRTVVAVLSTPEGAASACRAAAAFREAGLRAELDLSGKGLGAQMTKAAKTADCAVLIGPREAEAGVVAFKDLATGLQETLALDEAVARAAGREVTPLALAEELARQQRAISIAEFFEKNKHLLGFDSPVRGVITTVKEAVDNALDACEEAEVLPDIEIGVRRTGPETFRIAVEDNGPGIVPENVPYVFGKLLYGSRFHQIRQSRGQQGIGISAAVLYAQLTTGLPTVVTTRTGAREPAHRFELRIRVETNEPEILSHEEVEWDRTHGTRVEIEFRASLAAKKRLIEYLRYTGVVNPHARLRADIDGEAFVSERVVDEPLVPPKAIKPHPLGIQLGQLARMVSGTKGQLAPFLVDQFVRVGAKTADEICAAADLAPSARVETLSGADVSRLLGALQSVRVPPPPTAQCLSPIGEELLIRGLSAEYRMDFVAARTRPSAVYGGHPFMVEAAIGYGGKLPAEGSAQLMRFANRVPLIYQQGGCATTRAVADVNWRAYGLAQAGLPQGPILILVHVASTNVPFTSESKDAIAAIPEIEREVTLALQDLGRDLKSFVSRRDRTRLAEERARAVCAILPELAAKVAEVTERPLPDISPIEGQIMRKVVAKKRTVAGRVEIEVQNHTGRELALQVFEQSGDPAEDAVPAPDFSTALDDLVTRVWQVPLAPGGSWRAAYTGNGSGTIDLRGVDEHQKVVVDLDV